MEWWEILLIVLGVLLFLFIVYKIIFPRKLKWVVNDDYDLNDAAAEEKFKSIQSAYDYDFAERAVVGIPRKKEFQSLERKRDLLRRNLEIDEKIDKGLLDPKVMQYVQEVSDQYRF